MTLKADTTIETVPAVAAIAIDRVRLTLINIRTHPNHPYEIELRWLRGYADTVGAFVPIGRDSYITSDPALVGAIMVSPTLDGETAAAAIERIAFDMLQSVGVVPAGSIEV